MNNHFIQRGLEINYQEDDLKYKDWAKRLTDETGEEIDGLSPCLPMVIDATFSVDLRAEGSVLGYQSSYWAPVSKNIRTDIIGQIRKRRGLDPRPPSYKEYYEKE